jgi:hypothetical protein
MRCSSSLIGNRSSGGAIVNFVLKRFLFFPPLQFSTLSVSGATGRDHGTGMADEQYGARLLEEVHEESLEEVSDVFVS